MDIRDQALNENVESNANSHGKKVSTVMFPADPLSWSPASAPVATL